MQKATRCHEVWRSEPPSAALECFLFGSKHRGSVSSQSVISRSHPALNPAPPPKTQGDTLKILLRDNVRRARDFAVDQAATVADLVHM